MADEDQLKLIKQSVETWNQWRNQSVDIKPDLSEQTLEKLISKKLT